MTVHPISRTDTVQVGPSLHLTLEDRPQSTAGDFSAIFDQLEALLEVAALSTMRERLEAVGIPAERHRDMAAGATFGVYVQRVKYESPLEVVFAIGTAGATVALFQRVVFLFESVQRARRTKAETDVAVAEAKLQKEALEAARKVVTANIGSSTSPALRETAAGAAAALARMTIAEVEPGTGAG